MFCTKCGTKCDEDAVFCVGCGAPLKLDSISQSKTPIGGAPAAQPIRQTPYGSAPGQYYRGPPPTVNNGGTSKKNKILIPIAVCAGVLVLVFAALLLFTDLLPWGKKDSGRTAATYTQSGRNSYDDDEESARASRRQTSGGSDRSSQSSPGESGQPSSGDAGRSPSGGSAPASTNEPAPASPQESAQPILEVVVPDLAGSTAAHVESVFGSLGITPVFIETPDESPEGTVLSVEMAGQTVPLPVAVHVFVSSGPPPEPSTLNLSGHTLPPDQKVGAIFGVRGIIESNYIIRSVTVAVYNENQVAETSKTVSPNSYSYDIREVDFDILFDILTVGRKTYVVEATDEMGTQILLSHTFRVSA